MALLQTTKTVFVLLDLCFELLDVLCTPLAKCCLGLPVALLAFFRRSVYLQVLVSTP